MDIHETGSEHWPESRSDADGAGPYPFRAIGVTCLLREGRHAG
jgi:hypothetical protein